MADDIQYMTDAEIEATWGKGSAAKIREQDRIKRLAAQETFVAENQPVSRRRGGKKSDVPEPPAAVMDAFGAMPQSRAVGGVRKKSESDDMMGFRMNQGIPRGARAGGARSSLDQQMLMDEGMGAEEARIKSNIIRSRGGMLGRDKEGKLGQQSATARRAPISSTGRAYDPVAERASLMERGRAAVDMKKREQAEQQKYLEDKFAASQKVGTMRGFANERGFGQGETVLKDGLPQGTVTEGRNFPVTNNIREVIGWMEKDQEKRGIPIGRKAFSK